MKNVLTGRWVFDSNVLIYLLDETSPFHSGVIDIVDSFVDTKQIQVYLSPQNLLEAQNVLIKRYKKTVKESLEMGEVLRRGLSCGMIVPSVVTYDTYGKLVLQLSKKHIDHFDLYLAATMLDNDITQIITANDEDFVGIPGIQAYNPWKD